MQKFYYRPDRNTLKRIEQEKAADLSGQDYATLYDSHYFAEGCGIPYDRSEHWLNFFGAMADQIISELGPASVLDAGCAMGLLVESLRDRGVEAWGVDISEYAISQVREDIRPYCRVASLAEPLPDTLPARFDLVICIEVLEHMPRAESERTIEQLCAISDDLLISTTPFDYKEATHFNVQPPEYWASHFARLGFLRDVDFDAHFITPWAVRYRRTGEPLHRIVADYERRLWPLLKENADLRGELIESRRHITGLESHVANLSANVDYHAQQYTHQKELLQAQYGHNDALQEQLNSVLQDPTWQLLQRLHALRVRFAPPNSMRERWFQKLFKLIAR